MYSIVAATKYVYTIQTLLQISLPYFSSLPVKIPLTTEPIEFSNLGKFYTPTGKLLGYFYAKFAGLREHFVSKSDEGKKFSY